MRTTAEAGGRPRGHRAAVGLDRCHKTFFEKLKNQIPPPVLHYNRMAYVEDGGVNLLMICLPSGHEQANLALPGQSSLAPWLDDEGFPSSSCSEQGCLRKFRLHQARAEALSHVKHNPLHSALHCHSDDDDRSCQTGKLPISSTSTAQESVPWRAHLGSIRSVLELSTTR